MTSSTMPGSTPTFCCCRTRTCSTACTAGQILGVDDSLWNYDARRFDRYLLLSQGERDMDWVMDHTAILHFCGKRKPWNHSYQGRFSALYQALPAAGGAAVRAVPIHAAVFSGGRGRPPLPDGKNAGMAERSVLKQIKQAVPGFTRDPLLRMVFYFISSHTRSV